MQAIAAGCDGVADLQRRPRTQAAALEALVHAVEDGKHPLQARRGRAEAAAPRQGAVPAAPVAPGRRPALRARSAATSTSALPRRWRASPVMQAAPALKPGDRIAVVVAGQPVRARGVRRRRRRAARGSASSRCTTSRCSRASATLAGAPELRAGAFLRAWRDPSIAPRSSPFAAATAACSCCRSSTATPAPRRSCSSATATTRRCCRG